MTVQFFDHDAGEISEKGKLSLAFDHRSSDPQLDVSRAKVATLVSKENTKEVLVLVFPPTIRLGTIIRTQVFKTMGNQTVFEGIVTIGEGAAEITWGNGKKNDKPPEELRDEVLNEIKRLLFGE